MTRTVCVLLALIVVAFVNLYSCTELTFELPDSARECFYEEIKKNTSATLEFQVETILFLLQVFVMYGMFLW